MPQTPIAVPNSANPSLDADSFAEMPVIVCLDPRGSKTYGVMQPQVAPAFTTSASPSASSFKREFAESYALAVGPGRIRRLAIVATCRSASSSVNDMREFSVRGTRVGTILSADLRGLPRMHANQIRDIRGIRVLSVPTVFARA
jgi:hypothetical protein